MDIYTIIILVIIGLAVLIAAYVFIKTAGGRIGENENKFIKKQWRKIQNELKEQPKSAILEADKLLDHTLKLLGYDGSLGEKMKQANSLFSNANDIWTAHKLRNRIAHEMDIKVTDAEARSAILKFRKALKDLGVNF